MMENKVKMTFGGAYEAPDVQVTEVLVERGFEASLDPAFGAGVFDYGEDYSDLE